MFVGAFLLLVFVATTSIAAQPVTLMRVPNGGMKPSVAVDRAGVLHLVYFKGG